MYSIGLVAPFFLPDIGGANIYCFELARALAAAGNEVHVFTCPGAQEDASYRLHPILTRNLATDLERLDSFDVDVWHSLFFFHAPLALRKKRVFITGHGDDFFSMRLRFALPQRTWLERNVLWRIPHRSTTRLTNLMEPFERRYNHKIFSSAIVSASRLIAVSSYSRDRFCALYPEALDKTDVIPPGVAEAFFAERGNPLGRRRLLSVTRLDQADRIKNVHGVIQGLASLKHKYDFEYHIISGDERGSYRAEIESLITDVGMRDRVVVHGRKPLAELIDHYRSADLFVLASYAEARNFEGFGIVFLEANACGTPVLTSREGGMRDYVVDGENGFYVSDSSPDGIREGLERFFRGDVRFDAARVKAAPQQYRWSAIADRVLATYERH
jgi:glycosyltransferase involved in cell wall biosynthesis